MAASLNPEVGERSSGHPAPGRLDAVLGRIPLPARVVFYGTFFLAAILGGLSWLASRLEVAFPRCAIELGWLRLLGLVFFSVCLVT